MTHLWKHGGLWKWDFKKFVWCLFPREKKKKTGECHPALDEIQIRILPLTFLDEKDCRCFITGLETELESGTSNDVGGMTVVIWSSVQRGKKGWEKWAWNFFS